MSESNIKPIFFFKTPDLEYYICLTIGFAKSHNGSNVNQQTACRQMIWAEPTILVCPESTRSWANCIQMIVKRDYVNARSFKSNLKKNLLDTLNSSDVTYEAYQGALKFTILAKMSPKWCVVDNFLVEGEDFLTKPGPTGAIRSFELLVTKDKTHITFEGVTLNWPQIEKMPFGLYSTQEIEGYTLPGLKKCLIHSVTPVLCQWGPIRDYPEMTEFWKNMYGFKLPENPGCDLAYVTVNFGNSPSQYNYPKYCVLPHPPTVIARVDPFPIIGKFLKDFHDRVQSILGERIQFLENKAAFATTQISTLASLQDSKDFQKAGLTHSISAPNYPFKNLDNYKQENDTVKMEHNELPDLTSEENEPDQENASVTHQRYIPVFNARKMIPQMLKKENNKVCVTSGKVLAPETLELICNVEIKSNEPAIAKPKGAKPVDIETLAKTDMLSKANVAQLTEYLRSKNVPVKSKDKKPALMALVKKYLQLE